MISELQKNLKCLTKSLEILYILNDVKPVARIIIDGIESSRIINFFESIGLYSSISDFKVVQQFDKGKQFSNLGIKTSIKDTTTGKYFLYVSKDEKIVEYTKQLEIHGKNILLAEKLGYPDCCANFFEDNYEEQVQLDLVLPALRNSDGFKFPFYTNILRRYFDITLLNHFPHSFQCENSIELAKKYLNELEKEDSRLRKFVETNLKCGALYTEYDGVFNLINPKLKDDVLYFDKVESTADNEIKKMLEENKKITIINKNKIKELNQEVGVFLFE